MNIQQFSVGSGYNLGNPGKAIIPLGSILPWTGSATLLPNGKILMSGVTQDASFIQNIGVIRINSDGSLDTSFNGTGNEIIPVAGTPWLYGNNIVQADGKIVVVTGFNTSQELGLIRLNTDGSLDTSFNGTGNATIAVGNFDLMGSMIVSGYAVDPIVQADGKIVLVGGNGTGTGGFGLIRLNTDGSLDTSFNGTGKEMIRVGSMGDWIGSVFQQADGKILVAGTSYNDFNSWSSMEFGIIRLNTDGSLDTSFNGTGKEMIQLSSYGDIAHSVSVQPDGKILVAGFGYNGATELIRLNTDGSLDTSFNGSGKEIIQGNGAVFFRQSVSVQPDGKILVEGGTLGGTELIRLNTDGSLDTSFNGSGREIIHLGSTWIDACSMFVQPDGKIVVSGLGYNGLTGGFSLIRLNSDGSLDTSFNPAFTNTVSENTKAVTTVASGDFMLGSAPQFTLSGEDAALFKISGKGVLTYKVAQDHEAPTDFDHNGTYKVDVTLTNAKTHYAVTQNLVVGVNFAEIDGTAGADTLKGTKGWDTLDGKAGDDVLSGGDGLDTFIISAGHDTVKDFNALGKTWTGPGAEVLQVAIAGASVSATLKAAWSATSDTFNFGDALITTSGLAVDLSGVTTGLGWDVLNKGKATTLTGSMFDDTLTAGSGNDVLQGGAGNDTLIGGKLADTMTGGTGSDIFQLNGLKGIATAHHITDFVSGEDQIQLDSKIFKALGIGALSDSAWVDGTTATNSNQHIFYNISNGELFYDVDVLDKKLAVLIGVIDNHAALGHSDFMVV